VRERGEMRERPREEEREADGEGGRWTGRQMKRGSR
jgi:hypothetical protein